MRLAIKKAFFRSKWKTNTWREWCPLQGLRKSIPCSSLLGVNVFPPSSKDDEKPQSAFPKSNASWESHFIDGIHLHIEFKLAVLCPGTPFSSVFKDRHDRATCWQNTSSVFILGSQRVQPLPKMSPVFWPLIKHLIPAWSDDWEPQQTYTQLDQFGSISLLAISQRPSTQNSGPKNTSTCICIFYS